MGKHRGLAKVIVSLLSTCLLTSVPGAVDLTATVTDEDGAVAEVSGLMAVYTPAEWAHPRPETKREALSLVLRTASGSERRIEIPLAEVKRIDFDTPYTDPKATGSVPAWYPVRIVKRDGSMLTVAHGPVCVLSDAAGRAVESIPLSDERRVYDRSDGYAQRGYVFQYGSQSGVTGIGASPVAKPLLLTGFAGASAGVPFHIRLGRVRSIEFK